MNALAQLLLLAGLPLLAYAVYQKRRHKRGWSEIANRVGLSVCPLRYLLYSVALAIACVAAVVVWLPPLEVYMSEGSLFKPLVGLGLSKTAIIMAVARGAVQTALTEEIVFRGLIAGSLSRRLPMLWANVGQALAFLLPHMLILYVMPQMWPLLLLVFLGGLVFGWLRIKSGSILGPWLIHASVNVTVALSVATRTAT